MDTTGLVNYDVLESIEKICKKYGIDDETYFYACEVAEELGKDVETILTAWEKMS